jgi:hypothetical protein
MQNERFFFVSVIVPSGEFVAVATTRMRATATTRDRKAKLSGAGSSTESMVLSFRVLEDSMWIVWRKLLGTAVTLEGRWVTCRVRGWQNTMIEIEQCKRRDT